MLRPANAASVDLEPTEALANDAASFSSVVDAQMTWPARSHTAGTLREGDAGQEVTICGWVDRNRPMGGLIFMDVRDHTGTLQVGGISWTSLCVYMTDQCSNTCGLHDGISTFKLWSFWDEAAIRHSK